MWSERRSKLAQLSMTVAPPSLSGKSPIDDEFAERTSLRLHVSVTIAGDIASPTIVIADHHSRFNLLSKLLFSISNELINRLSEFLCPTIVVVLSFSDKQAFSYVFV